MKEYFKIIFGENYLLTQIIDYGILLHHGDLPQNVREKIEDYFRDEKIKLIICNTTLAEGVNLPIRTIVVHTTKWFNPENQKQEQLNVSDLKNLFGRAGRAGKETKGLIIIPNEKDFDIVKKVIEDLKLDSLKGYLYENIKNIHRIITQKKIIITNEILNSQNEEFKKLTDIIDKSIIDLLEEIIDPENIENQIQELIKNTFAFHQANEEEKLTLNTLIQLRGKAIKKSIQDNKFHFIKKSGSNLRLYEELENKLDIENALWMETTKPNDDNWLNFVLKILFSLPQIQYGLEKFNEKEIGGIIKESDFRKEHLPFRHLIEPYLERKNSYYLVKESYLLDSFIEIKDFPKELMKILQKKKEEKDKYLKTDDIKNVIKLWLEGKWFEDIAKEICNNDIDMSLRLINQFLGFNLQTIISTIVHLVDLKLQENNKQISPTILNFPEYLQYGLQNKNELDLIELGFTDRIGILALSEYFNGINYVYQEINELKIYLIGNKSNIIDSVKVKIPNIVLMEIRKSFEYL